jgi:hypothetical protein
MTQKTTEPVMISPLAGTPGPQGMLVDVDLERECHGRKLDVVRDRASMRRAVDGSAEPCHGARHYGEAAC